MKIKPTILVILDGFGYSKKRTYNAIYHANTQIMEWFHEYPSALLKASGTSVGLLPGMIGNSEVGHLTIGAGRIIKQPVSILHGEIKDGSFFKKKKLKQLMHLTKKNNKTLHIMGLLSDAGVHSHEEDLFALIKMAKDIGINKVVIHAFLDGRDVPPKSATLYLEKLEQVLQKNQIGVLGSIHGRFYAMDRDQNWQRTKLSYDVLTQKESCNFTKWQDAIAYYYQNNITDEFVPPTVLHQDCYIKDGDGLIFFNLREDRARQLTAAFIQKKFNAFAHTNIKLGWMITGIAYNSNFEVNDVLCRKKIITNTFLDSLEKANVNIFSIAETEKYAAVTYFFDGGREIIRAHETEIIIPSKSFGKTYEQIPQMSAIEIQEAIINALTHRPNSFFLVNLANADMVAHSGNFDATMKAIKCIDQQLQKIFDLLINKLDGTLYITSDHGNAEYMHDDKFKQRHTAHTTNYVPFIMIEKNLKHKKLNLKNLADIAPFILTNLGITVPKEMLRKKLI